MSIEYDETGTFYYFVLSFFAIILIPVTYYLFPAGESKKEEEEVKTHRCYCPPCQAKHDSLTKKEPRKKQIKYLSRIVIICLWALLIGGVVKVSQFEKEYNEYNPYDVLGIDRGASDSEIKKAGRQLSKIHHPDRGGDEKKFIAVSKAVQALTDPLAKENWDKYGNPDGPSVATYGIALPAWIVDKKNSHWVLACYMIAFIVILPIVVGTWWYRSIQYSADEVLMDTEQLYWYFFHRTPNMPLKRAIMILGSSFEFEKSHNKDIMERPSDNIELPTLMRELPHLNEKNKEKPLCFPYSVKARALVHAHFTRIGLPTNTLQKDLDTVLKKCPYLIKEMINVVGQLIALGKAGRVSIPPRLESLENLMKLSQMMTQAVWESKSAFLMLPHITQDHLRHFNTKKRNIKSIRQFIEMDDEERRLLLRTLSDEQYMDVISVCHSFPRLTVEVKVKVIDDEDMYLVTSGAIVTVVVNLTRSSFAEFFDEDNNASGDSGYAGSGEVNEANNEEGEDEGEDQKPAKSTWQRKVKKGKGAKKPVKKQMPSKKKKEAEEKKKLEEERLQKEANEQQKKVKKIKDVAEHDDDSDSETPNHIEEIEEEESDEEAIQDDKDDASDSNNDAESEFAAIKDDDLIQPEKLLEVKSKESHVVHAPYFPLEKHEYWWVYIVSKKTNELQTPPQQVTCLKEQEEVQLKFTAPDKPGTYQYSVVVRSDSYVDFDTTKMFKVEVTEAKEFDPGAHWDYSSDEEGKEDSGESVYETEDDEDAETDE